MWRDYSSGYIKNNRASGISVIVGIFIATLFLSFLCSMFYNFWLDDIAGIILEDGDWQGRITADISEVDLAAVRNVSNVETAKVNAELSGEKGTVVDISFYQARTIHRDMNTIVNLLGLEADAADYNYQLLSMYFIRIPGDTAPRLLMPAYLAIVTVVCAAMILVIHTSFAVSMNSRIHQFGIFSSIGATPGQIRLCLMQEAVTLTLIPALAGILSGILLSIAVLYGMNLVSIDLAAGRGISFQYHPLIFAVTFLSSAITVLVSAWMPAWKLSRLTPLEAIRGTGELQLKKRKHSRILAALFGMEGELAGNAWKAQKKAMRTTSVSLTLSFWGFMVMQCFFTLSGISTHHTYFARYQDAWDVMITVKNTAAQEFKTMEAIQELPGLDSAAAYQKADAVSVIPKENVSEELQALGGLEAVARTAVSESQTAYLVKAPVVILDDNSFVEYCEQNGITPGLDGSILVNRIWDSINSAIRYREYVPYIKEDMAAATLQSIENGKEPVEIPILAYTREVPVLREQYADYALVHVIPLSLWKEYSGAIGGAEKDLYVRLLAKERNSLEQLGALEKNAVLLLAQDYTVESENRIQDKISNDIILDAYELVLGAFCVLFAIIGVANVFSVTLGFLRQRRREFARYLSVGLTPKGLQKMFCIEALVVVGRPVLISLSLTCVLTGIMIKASDLNPAEFMAAAPVRPVLIFILAVSGFVALAYLLGGRRVFQTSIVDALRDDTLV